MCSATEEETFVRLTRPRYEELYDAYRGQWLGTVSKKDDRTFKAFIEDCGWTYNDYVIEYDRRRNIQQT